MSTKTRRASSAKARSGVRHEFLLALSDELRVLESEDDIARLSTRLLCEQLDADRCFINRFYEGEDRMTVGPGYRRPGLPNLEGDVRRSHFPELLVPLESGPFVVPDVMAHDAFTDERKEGLASVGIGSFVALPLRKGPRNPIWTLAVTASGPREWSPFEVNLVNDVAERAWSAMERARAETALRASQQELRTELSDARRLQEISLRLIIENDIQALYEQLLDAAVSLMDAQFASMQMLEPEKQQLVLIASRNFTSEATDHWRMVEAGSPTSCGTALASGSRTVMADVMKEASLVGTRDLELYEAAGIRSIQSTPLVSRGGYVVGMISTHWVEPGSPTERQVRLIDVLARQAADLIERRWAEEDLERINRRLERANKELERLNRELEQMVAVRTDELTHSEVRFRQAFELGSVAACITDESGKRFLEVNQAFADLTGYEPEELLSRSIAELEVWASRSDREVLASVVGAGERFEGLQLRIRVKDGGSRDVVASGDRLRLSGSFGWLQHFLDVTDRNRSQEELLRAIQEVMTDTTWFSRRLVERLAQAQGDADDQSSVEELSERERQVLTRVSRGKTNEEIAEDLGISARTVRNHIANIYAKIDVHSRAEAVVWARERGLTT